MTASRTPSRALFEPAAPYPERIRNFFYAEEPPYGLALVRIFLPLAMLIQITPRWLHARELYSTDGSPATLWSSFQYPGLLPEPSGPLAVALFTTLVFSLVTTSLGWRTRLSVGVAFVLLAYLSMLDMIGTLTKYSVIAIHVLLLLTLSPCGAVWSVDAWLARRRVGPADELGGGHPRFPVWPRRLIQILFCSVYFGAAITKLQTPTYFSGDQMYFWLLTDITFANPVGELASLYPPMLVVMALITILWEITFPFLCWRGTSRVMMLAVGILFHALTALMLGLLIFPLVCISAYWAWWSEADVQAFHRWLRRRARSSEVFSLIRRTLSWRPAAPPAWLTPRMSAPVFIATLCALLLAGLEAEHWLDPYSMRTADGPRPLKEIDESVALRMLAPGQTIRPEDQVFNFNVGTTTLGGLLADRRSEFRQGERAILECNILPPHSDMWVEANLYDAGGRMIHRVGQVIPRENLRGYFYYDLDESIVPGEYDFVLRVDGHETTRRRITLAAKSGDAVAATTATALLK